LEEHEDEDDAGHHDVKTCRDEPLVVSVVGHVEVSAVVGEVSEDDTDVDSTLFLLDLNRSEKTEKHTVNMQEQRPRMAAGAISAM
jgi:hypothetical protein